MTKKIESIAIDLQCGHRLTCKGQIPTVLLKHIFSKRHYHCHIHNFQLPILKIVYKHPKTTKPYIYTFPYLFFPHIDPDRWEVIDLRSQHGVFL